MSFFGFGKKKEEKATGPFSSVGDFNEYLFVVAYGIVNPFGPTLNLLIRTKQPKDGKIRFVLLQCHPFSPEIRKEWYCGPSTKEIENTLNVIASYVSSGNESCPTLFITGPQDNFEGMLAMLMQIAANAKGGLAVYNRCKKYAGNAFDRITEEVQEMLSKQSDAPMGAEKAAEFVMQQLMMGMQSELLAFKTAYEGAINFQKQNGSPIQATLPYEDFNKIMNTLMK